MKFVPIFVSHNSDDGLWAIRLESEPMDEFEKFFDQVNDVEFLHDFFEVNKTDLNAGFFGEITPAEAIVKTLQEAEEMENRLYDYAENGFNSGQENLQQIFKPLNNFEYAIITHQKSKARIKNGWLRLYAIRLGKNCYLVTGGAIKLTQNMKPEHLQKELSKLEGTKDFLRKHGIDYPEDLNTYQND